jgi:aquaporin Z
MLESLRKHWPEYGMEAWGLGLFMVSAAAFATLLEHPDSPVRGAIANGTARKGLMGLAMAGTNLLNVYSPWGRRSGCHLNPSVTLTFLRLGKVRCADAFFYALFQLMGGIAGVLAAGWLLGERVAGPPILHVATVPGASGAGAAFLAEIAISFGLMLTVLAASNSPRLHRFTGIFASALVATYILIESPISGMSMNPARSFAPALVERLWGSLWIYFTAPPIGMLLAAQVYLALKGSRAVLCAKLHHQNPHRCIFHCSFAQAQGPAEPK